MPDNTPTAEGSVTLRAHALLEDEAAILNEFSTPEAILDHLAVDDDFASVSLHLKRAIAGQGLCPKDGSGDEFVKALHDRMSVQDDEIMQMYDLKDKEEYEKLCRPLLGSVRPVEKITVRRWINDDTENIRNRSSCIRICMALGLDKEQADDLLNKCGFQSLSIRSAPDATLIYCLLNKRPLSAAIKIYGKYLDALKQNPPSQKDNGEHSGFSVSGDTTNRLERDILSGSGWENDEEFTKSFLLPNAHRFTYFSKAALNEYIKVKNPLMLVVLKEKIVEDDVTGRARDKYLQEFKIKRSDSGSRDNRLEARDIKFSLNFFNGLKKAAADDTGLPFLKTLSRKAEFFLRTDEYKYRHFENNLTQMCDKLGAYIRENRNNEDIQKSINIFLSDIITGDDLFSALIPATIDEKTGRKRPFTPSELAETVFYKFPHRQSLTDFEKDPSDGALYTSVRKAIVLMYYYAFAYEFVSEDGSYFSGLFEENTFEGFFETVNAALLRCRYAPLYPGNRFDWLVLVSIRKLELADFNSPEAAIYSLDDVLEASFPQEDED